MREENAFLTVIRRQLPLMHVIPVNQSINQSIMSHANQRTIYARILF